MDKTIDAINRIKMLECPTGDLENRVAGLLEEYGVSNRGKINIIRDDNLDRDENQAYRVNIAGEGTLMVVLAKSGDDDYVAKVTDVYSNFKSNN